MDKSAVPEQAAVKQAGDMTMAWARERKQMIDGGTMAWLIEFAVFIIARSRGWLPIDTAPTDVLVVVFWLDPTDPEHPERYDFDYLEEGVWVKHAEEYEHFLCVAPPGSRAPSEKAPYSHWMPLPQKPEKEST